MSEYSDLVLSHTALQSYWKLDEANGSATVADSKGSVTGTCGADLELGAPSLLANDLGTSAQGVALSISWVEMGDVYPFTGTSNYSLEAWIDPDAAALAANAYIFDNANSSAGEGWNFRMLASGALRAQRWRSVAADQLETAAGQIVAGNTYHVVCTYDGTNLRIYKNGSLVGGPTASSKSLIDPAYTLAIGSASGGGNVLSGYFDEVAIYNDDLDAATVLAHYDQGIAEPSVPGGRRIFKRLFGPAHLGTSAADLYTVPTGVRTTIRRIYASNPSGSPVDFTFSIGTDAAATRLYDSENIPAGDDVQENRDHTLEAGEKIQAFAGAGSTVVLIVDGNEEAL